MEFLRSVSASLAEERLLSFPFRLEGEILPTEEALGRVAAEDLFSPEELPPFTRSLVDGYAVKARDTYGAKETAPLLFYLDGEVRVGEQASFEVKEGHAVYVATGAMIPKGADGVVMQEYVRRIGDTIEVTRPIHEGENVILRGEDVRDGQRLIGRGERITAFHLAVFSALGIQTVPVYRIPTVSYLSTGDEIVEMHKRLEMGKVRDVNRYMLTALLKKEGIRVHALGIARDRKEELLERLEGGLSSDLLIVSGGSSKGERDLLEEVIRGLGGQIVFHGINIRPGKPTIFANVRGKPLFGLPGHPLSCLMVTLRFVLPFVRKMKGESQIKTRILRGVLCEAVPSSLGVEEYVLVRVEGVDIVVPIHSKSSAISVTLSATGYIVVPEDREGLEAGERVEVVPFDA
jgi:molybdopterin molybdotransferase